VHIDHGSNLGLLSEETDKTPDIVLKKLIKGPRLLAEA
jgi:hypothetical protein